MIFAIQQAYYLQAKNPSDNSTLIELAGQLGLDEKEFSRRLSAPSTQQRLIDEIEQTQRIPIQGFPSLVLVVNQQQHAIPLDYLHWENSP